MRLAGLLFLALGLWFIWQHSGEPPAAPETPLQQPAASIRIPDAPELPAANQYAIILERPLFSPQRRPFVAVEPAPQPVAAPRIRLSAITISNSVRVAVIREADSQRTRHIREGDTLGDWVVDKVGRNSVILVTEDQKITIPLFGGD